MRVFAQKFKYEYESVQTLIRIKIGDKCLLSLKMSDEMQNIAHDSMFTQVVLIVLQSNAIRP